MNLHKKRQKIAIIGAGISGLAAAHALHKMALNQPDKILLELTVFEAAPYFGGHTNTVDIKLEGKDFGVDTGFLVFNERTYPHLRALFKQLDVPVAPAEMSFSVSVPHADLEWAGTNLNSVFGQRSNLLRPQFLGMLRDIARFNKQTTHLVESGQVDNRRTLGEFLVDEGYGTALRDWYLLPMAGAIWSCSTQQMLAFPLATFLRFCANHGLLQIRNRPQWFTVRGGARHYVERIGAELQAAKHLMRSACPVQSIERNLTRDEVTVRSAYGAENFSAVVMATHSDQALALLSDASLDEKSLLGDVRYQPNRAVLHTDITLLPQNRRCWAAWNYFSGHFERPAAQSGHAVGVTYLLNKLQPLPVSTPVMVTLNPVNEPDPKKVMAEFDYAHPIFDGPALAAQGRLNDIQGKRLTWFAGAWAGYGFHEDGLKSGQLAAQQVWEQLYGTAS